MESKHLPDPIDSPMFKEDKHPDEIDTQYDIKVEEQPLQFNVSMDIQLTQKE